jgi:dienelactone hydrolase
MAAPELPGFTVEPFEHGGDTYPVYRAGAGPAVIVIHEVPGITDKVAAFGTRVADAGFSAVLPSLFGDPGRPASGGYILRSMVHGCVSREFTNWATRQTSPVTVWLRALARVEHERCGGPGVGAVGMCFTGGFALAMMVDDRLIAPVLSQPSLPFPVGGKRKRDLAISDADLARVKDGRPPVSACSACASPTTSPCPRSGSGGSVTSSVTAFSRSRSTRRPATPRGS